MGSHPVNLAIRFILELAALFSTGMWGWNQNDSWLRYPLAIGIPIIFATIWGTFNVPDDPSRSGKAPIVTPAILRLIIELGIFACASLALLDLGLNRVGLALGVAVFLHYLFSLDRIKWLLSN